MSSSNSTPAPSTQHPSHWRFAAVDGALCRLECMGAPAGRGPIAHVRTELGEVGMSHPALSTAPSHLSQLRSNGAPMHSRRHSAPSTAAKRWTGHSHLTMSSIECKTVKFKIAVISLSETGTSSLYNKAAAPRHFS